MTTDTAKTIEIPQRPSRDTFVASIYLTERESWALCDALERATAMTGIDNAFCTFAENWRIGARSSNFVSVTFDQSAAMRAELVNWSCRPGADASDKRMANRVIKLLARIEEQHAKALDAWTTQIADLNAFVASTSPSYEIRAIAKGDYVEVNAYWQEELARIAEAQARVDAGDPHGFVPRPTADITIRVSAEFVQLPDGRVSTRFVPATNGSWSPRDEDTRYLELATAISVAEHAVTEIANENADKRYAMQLATRAALEEAGLFQEPAA